MRPILLLLSALLFSSPLLAAPPVREGEILVKYRSRLTVQKAAAKEAGLGARMVRRFPRTGIRHLILPPGEKGEVLLGRLRSDPDVEYAVPNRIVRKALFPGDPLFPLQWGLFNSGQTIRGDFGPLTGSPGADARFADAWERTIGSRSVTVAVIDTGIDHLHPDLSPNIRMNPGETNCTNGLDDDGNGYVDDCRGWDFARNRNDPFDDDVDSHGTHVAGIIGAAGNDGAGVAGAAWQVSLLPLKILDSKGYGDMAGIVSAIEYAIDAGARIINASYTYPQWCDTTDPDPAELDALRAADRAGILVVAAAGNAACDNDRIPFYPASHPLPNILSVAAMSPLDSLATFSNRGVNSTHLAAPGVNVLSTVRHGDRGAYSGIMGYDYISGTSMAAPFVSGAAALAAALHPDWTHRMIREALLLSVRPRGFPLVTGGSLDAGAALAADFTRSAPAPPSHFTLERGADGARILSWLDNSTIETTFHLERRTGSSPFQEMALLPGDTERYTDSATLPPETEVAYRLRASNGNGFSGYTVELTTVSSLLPPANLSVTGVTGGVTLSWESRSTLHDGFRIERRREGEAEFSQAGTTSRTLLTFTDTEVLPGERYVYRVRAYRANSISSPPSNEVEAIVPGSGSSNCFIATAAYGSPLHPKVEKLRQFRDRVLLRSRTGEWLVGLYYRLSPPVAEVIRSREPLRMGVRGAVSILVTVIEYPFLLLLIPAGWVFVRATVQEGEAAKRNPPPLPVILRSPDDGSPFAPAETSDGVSIRIG